MGKKEVNISNFLTLFRLLIGPVIVYFILSSRNMIALGLFVLAELTDVADGYIAKRFNLTTRFGKVIDPFADKILLGFVIFAILIKNSFIGWIWFYAVISILFLFGYFLFVKKNMYVNNISRVIAALAALVLMIMIYGTVSNLLVAVFGILMIVHSINYAVRGHGS